MLKLLMLYIFYDDKINNVLDMLLMIELIVYLWIRRVSYIGDNLLGILMCVLRDVFYSLFIILMKIELFVFVIGLCLVAVIQIDS
jgi:hypothetical protein